MRVPFGEWTPDQADLASGAARLHNVLPTAGPGYASTPKFVETTYPAIPHPPEVVRAYVDSTGALVTLAFCKTKIYRLTSSAWVDISRAGDYTGDETTLWSIAKWGDMIYAANYSDPIQKFDLKSGGDFADMSTGLANGLRCRFLLIIRDFLVAFNCADVSAANLYPFRAHWSGRLSPETFVPSLSSMAGFRDIPDIGTLEAGTGGDYGLILGSRGSVRFDFIGAPAVWQVSTLETDVGCYFAKSVISVSGVHYWYSTKGWRKSSGGPSAPIGVGKVDLWFKNQANLENTRQFISPIQLDAGNIIAWNFVSNDSPVGFTDKILFYSVLDGRFTEGDSVAANYGTLAVPPLTVDDSDFGELIRSEVETYVDDQDRSDVGSLVGIGSDGKVYQLDPLLSDWVVTTGEFEITKGRRSRVTRLRFVGEGSVLSYESQVTGRDQQPPKVLVSDPWVRSEPTGSCSADKRARYHRVSIRGSGRMTMILGVDVEGVVVGTK